MRWVSSQVGKLTFEPQQAVLSNDFQSGIIELIAESTDFSRYAALHLAMNACDGALICCDRYKPPYAPAVLQSMSRKILWVRGDTSAAVECLRCKGVGAVILQPRKLSQVESRRLQLAAEHGGGVGILLRETNASQTNYAASARYHVTPARGDAITQRWNLTLLHGHGRRIGETVTLELSRETNHLRLSTVAADRSGLPQRTTAAG